MVAMIKKLFVAVSMAAPVIIHVIVMSVMLVLVLVNIKYGIEADLMSTDYFYLVRSVYDMVYSIYVCSIISFVVVYVFYLVLSKWKKNRKKVV